MQTDASVAGLAEKLAAVAPDSEDREARIARVKDNAKAAFDELEEMESKAGAGPN